jgi:hypothetical protein
MRWIRTHERKISTELTVVLVTCMTLVGCSSSSESGNPVSQGGAGMTGGNGAASGGSASTGGTGGLAGSLTSGGTSNGGTNGGAPTSGGSSSGGTNGGAPTSGGTSSGGSGGLGGATGGTGAGTAGTAGASSSGAAGLGEAGSSSGGQGGGAAGSGGSVAGSAGLPGSGGSGGAAGSGGTGGDSSVPDIACPVGATFCSGFEGSSFPSGTQFHSVGPSSPDPYQFDTAQFFNGTQSLALPMGSEGFHYRALAVPIPGENFWVRLYVRVSTVFGDNGHDSLFGASTGVVSADLNNETLVEFSEQFDTVLLNTKDQLFQPAESSTLSANAWHCIEAHYDGASGDVQIFADGEEVIHATGYARQSFKTFRLGLMQYHEARAVWFDDVVVAPTRVNCE